MDWFVAFLEAKDLPVLGEVALLMALTWGVEQAGQVRVAHIVERETERKWRPGTLVHELKGLAELGWIADLAEEANAITFRLVLPAQETKNPTAMD